MNTFVKLARWTALSLVMAVLVPACTSAQTVPLPHREGPPPETTRSVPHIQLGATPVPDLSDRLLRQVAGLPGVDIRATVISLPGARGFWLDESLRLARPDAIVGGREFAHLHPDGSLHASLPPERAREAVDAGWATLHPWAGSRPGFDGFVLIFTPRTVEETDTVFQLLVDGYSYVTGRQVDLPAQ